MKIHSDSIPPRYREAFTKPLPILLLAPLLLILAHCTPQEQAPQAQSPQAQTECSNPDIDRAALWERIEPFFSPTEEFEGDFGDYRSPLRFYDGREVTTADEWEERRQEIRDRWMEMMGEWPDLITDQEPEILSSEKRDNFMQHRVKFNWTPLEETEGWLMIPEDLDGPTPAVITVFYEPESAAGIEGRPHRDYAYALAKKGYITLSLGTTEASQERTYAIYHPDIDNAEVEPLSMLGYAGANAWHLLANMPEVDSERIGIVGHSFGGKWAMFASTLFDKFAATAWSDPGIVFEHDIPGINYWEPWYLGYHPQPWRDRGLITEDNPAYGLYPELIENGYDLTELHALMAPRPFLVSGGSADPEERWRALNHTIAINNLLGYENRVAMTNRPEHSPNPESNQQIYDFLDYFLMCE